MQAQRTDIMAPDNEPTDEELAAVMDEARDVAVNKRDQAAAELRVQVQRAVAERLARRDELMARASNASRGGT